MPFVRVEVARECHNVGRILDADPLEQAFRATEFVLTHIAVAEIPWARSRWLKIKSQIQSPEAQVDLTNYAVNFGC